MAKNTKQADDIIELTKEAYTKLEEELEHRKNEGREEIAEEIKTARELGDLRENQAYTFAMEKKDRNEDRIKELEDMLKVAKIVSSSKNSKVVRIGSKVQVTNTATKKKKDFTLMGSAETGSANPTAGEISVDSPIGQALHNAKVGEEVTVDLPTKKVVYKIEKLM